MKYSSMLKYMTVVLVVGLMTLNTGCIKPYDEPEYVGVKTSETAFVFKLEGDSAKQAKFDSAELLATKKVASKRIQITHRWNQTGRWSHMGKWIPEMAVIKVDRSPVTVQWESTGNVKAKDNAVWCESADSLGFSLGWACTAYIKEENAATFLYMYPHGGLQTVLDTEVRALIQQVSADISAKYKLDDLRDKKPEISDGVRKAVTTFFETRGITITTIGMFGGMTYENPKIQDSIDATFIAQQEKVVSAALLAAQGDKNRKIEMEALALAQAAETQAKGIANGNLLKAEAEAKGIEAVNLAIAKANNNPMLLELRKIEVMKVQMEKWTGSYPSTVVGEGANTWVGLGNNEASQKIIPVEMKK
jgi:hypothetical protein